MERNEPNEKEILDILRLPDDNFGRDKLVQLLNNFGSNFTQKEKLFILFYTYPSSKYCGKISKAGQATGGSWRSYGSWALQQPHIAKMVNELFHSTSLQQLEDFFRDDIQRNMDIINLDRTSLRKDEEFTNEETEQTYEFIKDKPIYMLNKKQKDAIADFEYDKKGNAHYIIEKRSEARQNLMNYYKMLTQNRIDAENHKTTETVVTLEGIKDKATAKIQIIQHNREDSDRAGEFIEKMNDVDEEA